MPTQKFVHEPVPDGIFTSYVSYDDPQFPSWLIVDYFSTVENDEPWGTVARVDESRPTISLPEELVPPFSRLSNFIDQVNDDGSGSVKLLAEQNLEKTLLDFQRQLKTNQIVAVQIWFPTKLVKTNVLRSSPRNIPGSWIENQRFMLDVTEGYLCESLTRVYSCDRKTNSTSSFSITDTLIPYISTMEEVTYLLNRQVSVSAFRLRCPQWAPNLHIYKHLQNCPKPSNSKENYIICGTLAIPMFDPHTNQCVGVYEVVIASTEIDLAVVDIISNLLKAVNLRADTQFHYHPRQRVLAEIMKVITKVCEDHDLPLAQTWMPCTCPDRSCNNSQQLCMLNAELPFYMKDPSYYPFWRAGAMYHMTEGQAVAGTTFSSKGLCFCRDITRFSDNFALVTLSRQFNINCSMAVCLGSAYANNDVYIVQFFWPRTLENMIEDDDLKVLSITTSMKQQFDKLSMVSPVYEELEAETERVIYRTKLINDEYGGEDFTFLSSTIMTRDKHTEFSIKQPEEIPSNMAIDHEHQSINHGIEGVKCEVTKKARKKKCNLTTKDDLLPYLIGTLKDAADELGISESTLKRERKILKIGNWQDERKKQGISAPPRKKRASKEKEL